VIITKDIIESGRSSNGGWSQAQLELFGIQGFQKGWKEQLVGKEASREVVEQFISLKDKHLLKKEKPERPQFIAVKHNIPYAEQYNHPNWQRMRLFVLNRDGFRCRKCGNHHRLLHVHHKKYERNKFIWEIDPNNLITLCEVCHSIKHNRNLT